MSIVKRPAKAAAGFAPRAIALLGLALFFAACEPGHATASAPAGRPSPPVIVAPSPAPLPAPSTSAAPASTADTAPSGPLTASPSTAQPAALTGTGQRIYERTRPLLLQVRTLLKTQDSQASVGSGFLVDDGAHLVTNFHVVSQYALQPSRYRLVYATVDGRQGALKLLAFDVVHDLAFLGVAGTAPAPAGSASAALTASGAAGPMLAGGAAVALRPADDPLPRGARIFSLGNPLDVGFAVAEGTYNGPVERSFLETLFFGGSLSPGMSGGPALDEQGRLIGVNVAARRDGEQVSFLVPAAAVRELIARGRTAKPIDSPAWAEVTRQLMGYQALLTDRFVALPWRSAGHPRYAVPVPQEQFMRCWGRSSNQAQRGLQFEHSECQMDGRLFISESLLTGFLIVRHESYDGSKIGPLRFSERYSASFRNEFMGHDDRNRTAPQCSERQVEGSAGNGAAGTAHKAGLPLKAVVCLRAYKKLEGLFDVSVLVATLDGTIGGVQGRLDAFGVSAASAQRLTQKYLDGFAWNAPNTASH